MADDAEMTEAGAGADGAAKEASGSEASGSEEEQEEEDDDDDDEDNDDDDGPQEPYVVPARASRGQRMDDLIGEAADADADFWSQDAWKEISDDDDIGSEEYDSDEKRDMEDADFDDVDELREQRERVQQALDQEEQQKRDERQQRQKRRKGVYVDPALRVGRVAARSSTSAARAPARGSSAADGGSAAAARPRGLVIPSGRRVRASTKVQTKATASWERQLARQRAQQEAQTPPRKRAREAAAKAKAAKAAKAGRLTQVDLLEEAARTEIENKRSLELMLMLQEEKRREKQAVNSQTERRVVRFSSARNVKVDPASGRGLSAPVSTVTFTYVDRVPAAINAVARPYPDKPVCAVTGLPARYRDPATGVPFSTVEAFKVLRDRAASGLDGHGGHGGHGGATAGEAAAAAAEAAVGIAGAGSAAAAAAASVETN